MDIDIDISGFTDDELGIDSTYWSPYEDLKTKDDCLAMIMTLCNDYDPEEEYPIDFVDEIGEVAEYGLRL